MTSRLVHSCDWGLSSHPLLQQWPLDLCPILSRSKRILLEHIRPGHWGLQTLQRLPFSQSESHRSEHNLQDLPGPERHPQGPSATPALPVSLRACVRVFPHPEHAPQSFGGSPPSLNLFKPHPLSSACPTEPVTCSLHPPDMLSVPRTALLCPHGTWHHP